MRNNKQLFEIYKEKKEDFKRIQKQKTQSKYWQ